MTVREFAVENEAQLNAIFANTEVLLTTGTSVVDLMAKRIFSDKENADGQKLLDVKPYSTKPIYVSRDIAGQSTGTFIGKKGNVVKNKSKTSINSGTRNKEIKSAYFPGGYKQFKDQLGRGALELTGRLQSEFRAPFYDLQDGALIVKFKDDKTNDIAVGNEALRGDIFAFNTFELDAFERIYIEELDKRNII